MTQDNQYKELLRGKINSAITQARAAKGISHKGLKGEILEILIRDLFRPLLPADIGIGTGQIINYYNKELSTQHDVILYDKSILPPILYEETSGIFPIECVLYTIEVKTTLTAQELRTSHEAAKKLNEFGYLPGLKDQHGNEINHNIEKVRSVIFALNTDLTGNGKNEAKRYCDIYKQDIPYLAALCVAEKEYWFERKGIWVNHPAEQKHDEIMGFIGGIMNTYKSVAKSRNQPCLGNYIIDTSTEKPEQVLSGTRITVEASCESCSQETYIAFDAPPILNVEHGYNSNTNCECGGVFKTPSGRYEIQKKVLVRVGEYEKES